MYWRKIILFTFTVLLPAIIVGTSNFAVFPDSSLAATLMLIVTVGVAGVFTYFSGDATARIRRYCIVTDFAICAILCANLGGHWILAREVSAARQGVAERHAEEDRAEQRRIAEAERQLVLKKADAELQREERRRLRLLPVEQRRSTLAMPSAEAKATPPTLRPMALVPPTVQTEISALKLTPEEVREKWWWFLTALAIAECAASVLAGAILAGVWEWDRNRDGIPDHLQRPQDWPKSLDVGK